MSVDQPPWEDEIPALTREHLADARLFADRRHMIDCLGPQKAETVVELGVAIGGFSRALIARYQPTKFYGIDTFRLHELDRLWGRPAHEIFLGKTHLEHYRETMSPFGDCVTALQGDGAEQLEKLPDASVDILYVDGSHHYPDVVRDCTAAERKIRPEGVIIFNDYILWSHREQIWYGVVPVVNRLVVERGARVIGLALHADMYADIAVRL